MNKLTEYTKRFFIGSAVALMTLAFPLSSSMSFVSANDCTAPANDENGVHRPTGSDAGTYTYQCDGTYAGQWTNDYYAYNPSSQQTSPLYTIKYRYICSTGTWQMNRYDYSPAQSSYYQTWVKANITPDQDTNCPVTTPANSSGTGQGSDSTNSTSTTGPGSNNNSSTGTNVNVGSTNNNIFSMNNGIGSTASTGNAGVYGNTSGGSASTGNAAAIATIANMLQSSANVFGPNTSMFTANINGDVNGDFMFNPSAIVNSGPNSTNSSSANNNLTVNQANNTDATINNNVNINANSGDATVANNTSGGDATSGNANAVANLMNLINSSVNAGKSFVGVVNINGNLNGDILLPPNLVNQLLAASGPNSSNSSTANTNVNATSTNNTNESINNNLNTTATTGDASVANNTSAGNATTGTANTNVTLLNLTGSQVVGSDDILVFVNVLGHWVGMIVNAPAGSTAASLGGGITSTGPNSSNSSSQNTNVNATSNNNTNLGINNNVNVNAQSGDATVRGNTSGGNATTGNANAAVNVLNVANSNLNLSNFFGVLFINVFGNWTGSFGMNTSAGDPVATSQTTSVTDNTTAATTVSPAPVVRQFASFVANTNTTTGTASINEAATDTTAVLGAQSTKKAAASLPTPDNAQHASLVLPAIGLSIAILMLAGERAVTVIKNRR